MFSHPPPSLSRSLSHPHTHYGVSPSHLNSSVQINTLVHARAHACIFLHPVFLCTGNRVLYKRWWIRMPVFITAEYWPLHRFQLWIALSPRFFFNLILFHFIILCFRLMSNFVLRYFWSPRGQRDAKPTFSAVGTCPMFPFKVRQIADIYFNFSSIASFLSCPPPPFFTFSPVSLCHDHMH